MAPTNNMHMHPVHRERASLKRRIPFEASGFDTLWREQIIDCPKAGECQELAQRAWLSVHDSRHGRRLRRSRQWVVNEELATKYLVVTTVTTSRFSNLYIYRYLHTYNVYIYINIHIYIYIYRPTHLMDTTYLSKVETRRSSWLK